MSVTGRQVRKLMEEMAKHGMIGRASMMAGMHRETARVHAKDGKVPSESTGPRKWRTRVDPIQDEDWAEVVERLREAPELEARALFDHLCEGHPDRYEPGQVRTLQRRIRDWRAREGPEKDVVLVQQHRPGEALQTDFTSCNELGITIGGEPFPHLLCHVVLPYSNWEWATPCRSESMAALKRGVQEALFRLGRVPDYHQTDNSTAATHDLSTGKRGFNEDYRQFVEHFGMLPRTIAIGESRQNGDVESSNNALKKRLKQHLLLRRSRDFESQAAYEAFLHEILMKANQLRSRRITEEMATMRPIVVSRFPEYREVTVIVTNWSTIRVQRNSYSVPSRLIGARVRVHIHDDRLEIFHGGVLQDTFERLPGRFNHHVDYRHVIGSLLRKPGGFARYRYREDLFPSPVFRRAYDALLERLPEREAVLAYLRILDLAAHDMESTVAAALEAALARRESFTALSIRAQIVPEERTFPTLALPAVDLGAYDALLTLVSGVAS